MAFRDCSHCRKFVYVESNGEPRVSKNGDLLERRPGKGPPCETGDCEKGHWSDPIEVSRRHEPLLEAYLQCRATGGRSMTKAEAADELHLLALSRIDEVFVQGESSYQANLMSASIAKLFASKGNS